MLSHARHEDCVAAGDAVEFLHHVLGLDHPVGLLVVGEREVALPPGDRVEPVGALGRRAIAPFGDERLEHRTGIADDRDLCLTDLADLGGVDVGVDHLGERRERRRVAGDAVVEAHADPDEEVGFLDGRRGGVEAVHPRHAQGEGVGIGDGAPAHEGRDDREVRLLGELDERFGSAGLDDPATDIEDGSLGCLDAPHGLLDAAGMRLGGWLVAGEVDRGVGVLPLELGIEDVLRDVDEDRAGATCRSDVEGLPHDRGDVGGVGHQVVVLGGGHRDPGRVGLLEGVVADRRRGDLAGDRHHRHRVHERIGEGRDEVRRAGARRRDHDADPTRRPGVPARHVPCTLFVAGEDVADRAVEQRVVGREDRPAGHAEYDIHPLVFEGSDECLGSREGLHDSSANKKASLEGGRTERAPVSGGAAPIRVRRSTALVEQYGMSGRSVNRPPAPGGVSLLRRLGRRRSRTRGRPLRRPPRRGAPWEG